MTACGAVGKGGVDPDSTAPAVIVGFHAYRHEIIIEYTLGVFAGRGLNYTVRYVVEMGGCYRCVGSAGRLARIPAHSLMFAPGTCQVLT
jgi:hypothetical protein